MAAKVLINGKSGVGKSSLIKHLEKPFVISRDGKEFPFELPHMTIRNYTDMKTILYGGTTRIDGENVEVEGVVDKLEKYVEIYGEAPGTVVIDSVSKLMQDAIDASNLKFTGFDIHSNINKEIAHLTTFVQEYLVANGVDVVLVNHVMENDKNGYIPVGQGKFKDKGGYYSEVDESILVTEDLCVIHRGAENQARTLLEDMPDKTYLENIVNPSKSRKLRDGEMYFNLQEYIDRINERSNTIVGKFEI